MSTPTATSSFLVRPLARLAGCLLAGWLLAGPVAWIAPLAAGEFNPVLDIGDPAPRWEDLRGVDGKLHGFDDVAKAKCVVVAFTCNTCPYAHDVEERLLALTEEFSGDAVALVAINVNLVEADLLPAMQQRAAEKGFKFPYLHDPTQQIAKAYGALRTPEFFVIDRSGKLVYMGALDDSPDGTAVQQRYVADAVRATLRGEVPQVTETVPIGCRIRFSRARR